MGLNNILFHNSKAGKNRKAELDSLGLFTVKRSKGNRRNKSTTVFQPGAKYQEVSLKNASGDDLENGNITPLETDEHDKTSFVHDYPVKINSEKQSKHIPGSKYFQAGKSRFLGTVQAAQRLIKEFAGKGEWIEPNRERVNFKIPIGIYVNYETGEETSTTIGIIHYSKNGAHIVPANPKGGI